MREPVKVAAIVANDENFDEGPAQPQPASQEGPAFLDRCRAARIGDVTHFAECLVEARESCQYGFSFGNRNYCEHPRREAIIARTLDAEGPSGRG
jgi:hypothetical protein